MDQSRLLFGWRIVLPVPKNVSGLNLASRNTADWSKRSRISCLYGKWADPKYDENRAALARFSFIRPFWVRPVWYWWFVSPSCLCVDRNDFSVSRFRKKRQSCAENGVLSRQSFGQEADDVCDEYRHLVEISARSLSRAGLCNLLGRVRPKFSVPSGYQIFLRMSLL